MPGTTTNPASEPTTKPTVKFSVATYNINYGNVNLKKVVKTIRKADAHLVCLQETNRRSEKHLRRAFKRKYRYMYFRSGQAAGGFGVLSKSPIKKLRYLPRKYGYFGTLLFHTKLGSKKVQVANVHLQPTVPRRGESGIELLKLFFQTETIRAREIKYIHDNLIKTMPTILIGDFNSPPYMTVPVFLVKHGFTDSFAAVTRGANTHTTWRWRYRNTEWKYRLDYIFCNARFKTLASKIIKSNASDHYLVTSTLEWATGKSSSATSQRSRQARLTIQLNQSGRTIPPLLFGSNIQWERNGDGTLASDRQGRPVWLPGLIKAVNDSRITCLRFPGGSLSNTYRWQSGIGNIAKRPTGRNIAGLQAPSHFGSDEFIRLCRQTRLQGIVTVNISAGAREAADWVEYLNGGPGTKWGARRSANGLPKPLAVKYWEIGNELFSPKEKGHSTAADYARKVVKFAKAMKARDPSIKVGAHLEASFLQAAWMKNVHPHLLTWNEEVLKVAGRDIDFVVLHFYAPFDKLPSEDDLHRLVWAGPVVFEQNVAAIRVMLKRFARPGVKIALSEYGTFFGGKVAPHPRIGSTENALFSALILFTCIRDPDITMANHWSLINNSSFGILRTTPAGRLTTRPTYQVLRSLAPMAGMKVLPLRIDGNGYAVQARGNIPGLKKVPYLDAVAVRGDDGLVRLAVVNRSPNATVEATLSFVAGIAPPALSACALTPGDEKGTRWKAPARQLLTSGHNGLFRYRFPPQSFTVIRQPDQVAQP